jgi:phage terminase large subunit
MKCTSVFSRNIKAYKSGKTLIVNQGGTRSSKTYSIMQLLFLIALGSKKKLVISVCSYALPHLKLGSMRDLEEIIENYCIPIDSVKNISESTFHIGKSIIEFFGTDNLGKVHGPARDILFINECNYVKYDAFDHLAIRTKGCVFLDFNPTREFWYHTDVIGKIDYEFIQSTYKDNEFLTLAQIERIEAKKLNENWWRVYGLGELGRLEGAILQNWNFGDFDNTLPYGYGLDFGVKDPDAMVKVAIDKAKKVLYWKEELYQNSLSTGQLTEAIKSRGVANKLIIADSAATRTILDLKGQGLNIKPVSKGLVNDDIKMLLDWNIIIDNDSFNLQRELNNWVWLDKKGEIPLDAENHLIDAARYYSRTVIKPIISRPQHRVW